MNPGPILVLAAVVTSASAAEITIHNGGKLIVNSQITGGGEGVLVESGGEFQLDGIANTAVAVAGGGVLDVGGDDVASVQINGGLTLAGTLRMQLGDIDGIPANDHISGITSLIMGGTLDLEHLGGTLAACQAFDLWDAAITAGNVPQITGSALPDGLFFHTWDLPIQGIIHVSRAAETYEQWAAACGAGDSGTDLDDDGTVNLLEFALAIDPDDGGDAMPTHEMVQDGSGTSMALLVHLPVPCPPGSVYIVEASDSLEAGAWQVIAQRSGNGEWSGTAAVTPSSLSDGIQTYRITDTAPAGSPKRFMRLRVE